MAQTTLYTSQLIIVVAADIITEARGFAAQVDPSGSTNQFFAGLSANGLMPVSHYWCHWTMLPAQEVSIKGRLNALIKRNKVTIFDAHTTTTAQAFAQLGLKMVGDS